MSKNLHLLTQNERATYQSLVDRGVDHYEAMEAALDGVDVETVREGFRA